MPFSLKVFRPRPELVWRTIHWPTALEPERAVAVLRQVGTDHFVRLVALEVEATSGALVHRIGMAAAAVGRVEQLVAALVCDAALTPAAERTGVSDVWRVVLTNRHRPLEIADPERVTRAVLAALTNVDKGERVVVQWLLGRNHAPRAVAAATPAAAVEPWWGSLTRGESGLDPERRRALESKRSDHAFACIGRVAIRASTPARTRALAVAVLAGLRTAEAPGIGVRLARESSDRFNAAAPPWVWPCVLNVLELVGLLAWPLGDKSLPGFGRDVSRWLRPDPRIRPHRRVLGRATAPGEARELGLSVEDARQHLHVIGPTGTGKSTLLANLALADIRAGRGVVVIEPKGDLVEDILARLPSERAGDVVVFDPAEAELPVGLNPLLSHGRSPELIADQVLAVFRGLSESWGPRLQVVLHAALLTLARRNDASLCALPALLTNPAVRRRLRAGGDDLALDQFWAWFEALSPAEQQQVVAPVLTRLQPVLLRSSVRTIVGQLQPRFRIEDIFTRRKIVLVVLRRGVVGPEAAALLGSLFVAELWQATLGRAAILPERRQPVIVYADEFQDYVHLPTDMADALAQARGLGVGLVLAHQHLAQLPGNLRAAVLANARSRVCFQLAADDAQIMAKLAGGKLLPGDFQRLGRFDAYAQIVVGGEVTEFASIRTLPLGPATSDPLAVRELSRRSYGRPVDEVEAEIRQLLEGQPNDGDQRLWTRGRGQR